MKFTRTARLLLPLAALTACASGSHKNDETARKDLADTKALAAQLQARVDALETKLAAVSDKVDSTRGSIDHYVAETRSGTHPVLTQPSEDVGVEVKGLTAPSDPGSGFQNDEAVRTYRKGMLFLRAEKYPETVLTLSTFLEKYPDHPLAGSAQFYVGEAYYRQKEYLSALQEYQKVLTSYDRSSHVSDTLREMAEVEEILKRTEDAARHRQLLTSLFPLAPAAATVERGNAPSTTMPAGTSSPSPASGMSNSAPQNAPALQTQLDAPPPTAPAPVVSPAPATAPTGSEIRK